MPEVFKQKESQAEQKQLRQSFRRIFWDIDTERLDFGKDYKLIITQVMNYGYPEEIQALFRIYAEETIREVLRNPMKGVWTPKTYQAFCRLLDIEPQKKAVNILMIDKKTRNKTGSLFNYLLKV